MTFGEKLKYLREMENLTQEEMVKKLLKKAPGIKITREQFTNWEQGRNYPRMEVMLLLTKHFKTSMDDLFNPEISLKKMISNRKTKPTHHIPRLAQAS